MGVRLHFLAVILAVCTILRNSALTSALRGPYEKVHVYDYTAEISTKIQNSGQFASKFVINGNLKIQSKTTDETESRNTYFISLTNLQHDLNYRSNHIRNLQPLPQDMRELENPFLAIYDKNGKFEAIKIQINETESSKNIKKSIASMLQLNWSTVDALSNESFTGETFVEENTVHGRCYVTYNIMSPKKTVLKKAYKPEHCSDFVYDIRGYRQIHNDPLKQIQNEMDTRITYVYQLEIRNNKPVIKTVISNENYAWKLDRYPFGLDSKSANIEQNLIFINITNSDEFAVIDESTFVYSNLDSSFKKTENIYENHLMVDGRKRITQIKKLFVEVSDYMKQNRLVEVKPGSEHRQLLNRIQIALDDLDIENLELLYNEINNMNVADKELIRFIFTQMIPYIGTKSSSLFLKNLIMTKKVSDTEASVLIKTWPSFIRQPTKQLLHDFEIFINKNNGLSLDVQKNTILSYSYLISRVYKESNIQDDSLMERLLHHLGNSYKFAETIHEKLVDVMALGNTRSIEAIKYLTPILLREQHHPQSNDSNQSTSANRLRLEAIYSLARIIDNKDDMSFVMEQLTRILFDKTESRTLRLAAYDVIVTQADNVELRKIHRLMMFSDPHLRSYHRSTIYNLQMLNLQSSAMNGLSFGVHDQQLLSRMSRSFIISVEDIMHVPFLKGLFQNLDFKFLRSSIVFENDFPVMAKYELLNEVGGKLVNVYGAYWYTNQNKLTLDKAESKEKDIFFDLSLKSTHWIYDMCSIELSDFNQNKILDMIRELKKFFNASNEKFSKSLFDYMSLTQFSIPTTFGTPVVFQNRKPRLLTLKMLVNSTMEKSSMNLDVQLSLDFLTHEYSDVSIYNPIAKLTHSANMARMTDMIIPMSFSFSFNFLENTMAIHLPIILKTHHSSRGISDFTSSSVIISTEDDETTTSCSACGYEWVTAVKPEGMFKKTTTNELKVIGMKITKSIYNCNIELISLDKVFDAEGKNIKTCGILRTIDPDSAESISQLEVTIRLIQGELSSSLERPWYFIPGCEFYFRGEIVARKKLDNSVVKITHLDINASRSQGHRVHNFRVTYSVYHDEYKNMKVCLVMDKQYPNISDTHLPTQITDLKIYTNIIMTGGFSDNKISCPDDLMSFEIDITGEMSRRYITELSEYTADSICALQRKHPLYVHPRGSFPLTKECIHELITNTTLNQYTVYFSSNNLLPLGIVQSEIAKWESVFPMANIQLISPTRGIFTDEFSIKIEFPLLDMLQNSSNPELKNHFLDSVYFPKDFINNFRNGNISVINVFPGIIIIDDNTEVLDNLTTWRTIDDNHRHKISVKSVGTDKLAVKINYEDHELRLEPMRMPETIEQGLSNNLTFKPIIYFDNTPVNDFDQRTVLLEPTPDQVNSKENNKYLFSLLKIDDFIMIRPRNSFSVFYTTNSVTTILKRINKNIDE